MGISGRDLCFLFPPQCATSGAKMYFLPNTTSPTQQENGEHVHLFSAAVFYVFEDLCCLGKVKERVYVLSISSQEIALFLGN